MGIKVGFLMKILSNVPEDFEVEYSETAGGIPVSKVEIDVDQEKVLVK